MTLKPIISYIFQQAPRLAPPQALKNRPWGTPAQKLAAVLLAGSVAATTAFGQVMVIWNGAGDGTNFDAAANYGGTLPSTGATNSATFNGVEAGNLVLNYSTGNFASGSGSSGINIILTASQTGSVSIDNRSGKSSPNIAIDNITNNSPGGGLQLGSDTVIMNYAGRPAGTVHALQNNSTADCSIGAGFHMVAGGGNAYTMDFSGTGNWDVHSYLVTDNTPANNTTIEVDGPGTLNWNPINPLNIGTANSIATINITGGTLNLTHPHPKLLAQAITDNGTFVFNSVGQAQTLSGVISGTGSLVNSNGTLTLSGASTYSGNTVLAGGEVYVAHAETPGTSGPMGTGTILFTGGTLGYNTINQYDYSPRFSTADNQPFNIDTAGQSVTFTYPLAGNGSSLTKLNSGTLTLAAQNTYTGNTTISAGEILFASSGTLSGTGNITVGNSTILGVTENGSQITPGTLTVGTTGSATLAYYNVNSTTAAPLAAGTVSAGGPILINIYSGIFNNNTTYPLISWSSGPAPAVTLGTLTGAGGVLVTNGNSIALKVTSLAYVWTGLNNDGNWDTSTPNNWKVNGVAKVFANGGTALFDDTASGPTTITVNSLVSPGSVTFNASVQYYTVYEDNAIGGPGGLTDNGGNPVTLIGGVNTYTGPTTFGAGMLTVGVLANGGTASDIGAADNTAGSWVFNGGALQYTGGGVTIDHLFTLGTAGGTVDDESGNQLWLNNTGPIALSGTGARTLTLTGDGSTDELDAALGDNGGATALTKNGPGTWLLTGTNSYSGVTTIASGKLQVGNGGATGSIGSGAVVDHGTLDFNLTTTVTNGAVSGVGSVINDGPGTVILAGNNTYSGGTTINQGTLQIGNGGASGIADNGIKDNGTLIIDTPSIITLSGYILTINGTGNVIVRPGSFLKSISGNTYTGWTEIDPGGTFQPADGNAGSLSSPLMTNNGTLFMTRQDPGVFMYSGQIVGSGKVVKENNNQNSGDVTLAGIGNSYTGGTWIAGGGIILGDGTNAGAGWLLGNIIFTNTATAYTSNDRYLNFNMVDATYTVTNNIISNVTDGSSTANSGSVSQLGTNTLIFIGNNNYPAGTTITNGGTLQVGNGGTSGSVGSGAVTDNGTFAFSRADNVTFGNVISGTGSFLQLGPGSLTLTGANTYTGSTTVSNGTLVLSGPALSVGGNLNLEGGTLVSGGVGALVTNTVAGNMEVDAGTLVVNLNTSVAQSNTFFNVTGTVNSTGGTLQVNNVGPNLAVGQTFTLFNKPWQSAAGLTITGAGATWQNNLAGNGSITVVTYTPPVNTNAATANFKVVAGAGNTLTFTWAADHQGWQLYTNSVGLTSPGNWFPVAGSSNTTTETITNNLTQPHVFFQLRYP